ncbi:MAG TPA: hypothetical protein VJV75_04240 [Candidatus Polarisedimenticolia bacterium]|nr:hypothetical protein [Candidatus Polarisedimenticolia bacterium]
MKRLRPSPRRRLDPLVTASLSLVALLAVAAPAFSQAPPASAGTDLLQDTDLAAGQGLKEELLAAAVRLPLAAALGAVLALRPRRRGTPIRDPAVVQTQIVLAAIGGVIMLVVGASLARAFAIVGVASLVRYRSKVDNPKDAVVMLSALAVGLASGVGLIALAVFSTLFLVAILYLIEGFEPQTRVFELSVRLGDKTTGLKPKIEAVLRGFKVSHELRASSAEEASYYVTAPHQIRTDRVTKALTALAPDDQGAVVWNEKKKAETK